MQSPLVTQSYVPDVFEKNAQQFALYQNYPNPFSASTFIEYYLPKATNVKIMISDIHEHLIREIQSDNMPSGKHLLQSIITN